MSNRQPLDLDQEAPCQVKDKRGGGWFRIDNDLVDDYLSNRRISRDAYAIYTVLVRFANWKTGTCYPAIKTLCHILGYKDPRTLHKHLDELIEAKLIEMKEQEFSRGGKCWTGYLFTLKSITAPLDDDVVELFHPMEGDGVESMQT